MLVSTLTHARGWPVQLALLSTHAGQEAVRLLSQQHPS